MNKNQEISPLVSGLVSLAEAHCTVPPADHGVLSGSPRAAERKPGRTLVEAYKTFCDCTRHWQRGVRDKTFIIVSAVTCRKTCFNPDSPSPAHPFYVLDNFIDVGLIDLNLLPGNKESDGLSLGYNFFWISSGKIPAGWINASRRWRSYIRVRDSVCVCASYSSARCFSLVFAWLIFSVLLRSICLFSSFFSLKQQDGEQKLNMEKTVRNVQFHCENVSNYQKCYTESSKHWLLCELKMFSSALT